MERKEMKGNKIELWDKDSNYIWGDLKGKEIELWDHNSNYIWGDVK